MKNIKLLTAMALMAAAAGAYAGTDDGNVKDDQARSHVTASVQAPAPAPVAASAAETEVRTQDSGVVSPNP